MGIRSRVAAALTTIVLVGTALVFAEAPAAFAVTSIPSDSLCSLPGAILGTPDDDTLTGTAGDDIICGLGGNDHIDGLGGDDVIIGGDGLDTLIGGPGNDIISGEIGDDYIDGQSGLDSLFGGTGEDALIGGPDDDYISGGEGADNLFGLGGLDQLIAGPGNDSLNGGLGADTLDGGVGVNTCQKDLTDRVLSCYYDKGGPALTSVAINPADASLDSSDPQRKLHIRFVIKDPGTGWDYMNLDFADAAWATLARKDPFRAMGTAHTGFSIYASAQSAMTPCSEPNAGDVCLVKGTSTSGVFDATVTLPRNLKISRYYLTNFYARDLVSNSTTWIFPSIVAKKVAVSFAQTGTNDTAGPRVSAFSILGNRRLPTSTSSVIAEVSFSDLAGNGLGQITAKYALVNAPWPGTVDVHGQISDSDWTTSCPSDVTQIVTACRVSGDHYAAIFRIRMTVWGTGGSPKLGRGNLKLTTLEVRDGIDNLGIYGRLTPVTVAAAYLSESFGATNDSDHTPPELLSFTASKSRVDTGAAAQTVDYRVIARDTGKGIDTTFLSVNVMRPVPCNGVSGGGGGGSCAESIPYCTTQNVVRTGNQVKFTTHCALPAHFPSGTFQLSIMLMDRSGNSNTSNYGPTDLARLFGVTGTLING